MPHEPFSFEHQLERLKMAVGASSDSALARVLGISQGSISGAKGRQKLPPEWVKQIALDFGISSDWLYFGEGQMHREQGVQPTQQPSPDTDAGACPRCAKLEKELEDLRQEQRKERDESTQHIRELTQELREVNAESRRLAGLNGELRERIGRLEEQRNARASSGVPSTTGNVA